MSAAITETPLSLGERLMLAKRVAIASYYTDGVDLYEVEDVGPTGCVTIQNSASGDVRCLSIEKFRQCLWLVRGARDRFADCGAGRRIGLAASPAV